MKPFFYLLLALPLAWGQVTYNCGSSTSNPVDIQAPTGSAAFTTRLSKSSQLCVLVRVSAIAGSGANVNNLSRFADLSDYNVVPVARSYSNNNWERVAGPYAQSLSVSCSGSNCDLNLPSVNGLDNGKFYLMAFSHSLNTRQRNARFLEQVTFGATNANLNSFSGSYANYIKNQMNISPTLHRAYFRERVEGTGLEANDENRLDIGPSTRITGPCESGSKWTRFAFTSEDWGRSISASIRNGQWLLSVNNVPRTIVDSWVDMDGNALSGGSWTFCWWGSDTLGGEVGIYDISTDECFWIANPPMNLPFTDSRVKKINLSALSGPTIPIWDQTAWLKFGEVYTTNSGTSGCSGFTQSDYLNVIGTRNNVQYRFAGYVELTENTLENPNPNGSGFFQDYWMEEDGTDACANPVMDEWNKDTCIYSTASNACSLSYSWGEKKNANDAVVICGSNGEVANRNEGKHTFQLVYGTKRRSNGGIQKKSVWSMIALEIDGGGSDQLRQRVAHALSQILVVTENQVEGPELSEVFLNYYDIFVRHAFGNYFDILKEVAFSPIMGEMLSYVNSVSAPYSEKLDGFRAYPDENFAREIMQLFTIGIFKLSMDGTPVLENGDTIATYDNTHIQNFARAWTGFQPQPNRANWENWGNSINRMDPMRIVGPKRDPFPKIDLDGNYIGDKIPLCVDLPKQQFLKIGAKFRLLGSLLSPRLHHQTAWWVEDGLDIKGFQLSTSSNLFSKLCNGSANNCNYSPEIILDKNLDCVGEECNVDEMRIVQVQSNPPVYYEYIRPKCVELAFYENAKTVTHVNGQDSMCANPLLPAARSACCANWGDATEQCKFTNERTTFATASSRCNTGMCQWNWIDDVASPSECAHWGNSNEGDDLYHWTGDEECTMQVKVNSNGHVSIVHNPYISNNRVTETSVRNSNSNFFPVSWNGSFPTPSNNSCGPSCNVVAGTCFCSISIEESQVFSRIPSVNEMKSQLFVGAPDPDSFDNTYYLGGSNGGVTVFHKNGNGFTKDSIFRTNDGGDEVYFKNVLATVQVGNYSFRNPPQFLNLSAREPRDAIYETEEVLKHFFYHDNVAPFLATRLIQRFGISNPSPRYVEVVANAFKNGSYNSGGVNFGQSKYGDLASTIAAIILDREARSEILDADPSSGSLREPLLKVINFMKSMDFVQSSDGPELRLWNMQNKIGQGAHEIPNVFSFFRPEYATRRHQYASLTSPEAIVITAPRITRLLNGLFSLVDYGLSECYDGFGEYTMWCDSLEWSDDVENRGYLRYPTTTSLSGSALVDDLSTLLTGGRLNQNAKDYITSSFNAAGGGAKGRKVAMKLIVTTPEFHTTQVVHAKTANRPEYEAPSGSGRPYKAVVFLMLDGGADSYNILVPNSNSCRGANPSMYNHYSTVRSGLAIPRGNLLNLNAASSNQICETFGLHPNLTALRDMYQAKDLLFASNVGVLQRTNTNKDNWWLRTDKTELFAHNVQADEAQAMDIYHDQAGTGVGGRMVDVLNRNGFTANTVSANGVTKSLTSAVSDTITVDSEGLSKVASNPYTDLANDFTQRITNVNKAFNIGSGTFAETWSSTLTKGMGEIDVLATTLQSTTLTQTFNGENELSRQFETVAKMIKAKGSRGSDRDVFYVEHAGYDTHSDLATFFNMLTTELNEGVDQFKKEMDYQGRWNDVTIVMVSEFSRTLTENSGQGSDHAWAGNYFVAGGSVEGQRIIGQYPERLQGGDMAFEPGILIPTTSWEAIWNGVAQWFGITSDADLNEVLPNRNTFSNNLFTESVLYGGASPPTPTPPTPDSCEDSPLRMRVYIPAQGRFRMKSCNWAAKQIARCNLDGVSSHCPVSCNASCMDTQLRFKLIKPDGTKKTRNCNFVSRNSSERCKWEGVSDTCREVCS